MGKVKWILIAVNISLALAGCGGGGSSTDTSTPVISGTNTAVTLVFSDFSTAGVPKITNASGQKVVLLDAGAAVTVSHSIAATSGFNQYLVSYTLKSNTGTSPATSTLNAENTVAGTLNGYSLAGSSTVTVTRMSPLMLGALEALLGQDFSGDYVFQVGSGFQTGIGQMFPAGPPIQITTIKASTVDPTQPITLEVTACSMEMNKSLNRVCATEDVLVSLNVASSI